MCKFFLIVFFFLTGCSQNHLNVSLEKVAEDYLASVHVKTPDYRQDNPPYGIKINVSWAFPGRIYQDGLTMCITARLWDSTEEKQSYKICNRVGMHSFFFFNETKENRKRVLTYCIEVFNQNGDIVEIWKHHFWTDLIDIDIENDLSEQ